MVASSFCDDRKSAFKLVLLVPLFWYCEIQDFHMFLGLRHLEPHSVPRPPAMLSNDLRSLNILSKTRLSIPHLRGRGGGNFLGVFCRGEENLLTLALQENYIPLPSHTHRKNDTTSLMEKKY